MTSYEGSGSHFAPSGEDTLADIMVDLEQGSSIIPLNNDSSFKNIRLHNRNFSSSLNRSLDDIVLFSLSSFQENLIIFVVIGSGVIIVIIIIVIFLIIHKNRSSARSNLNRKFDTFQNPIYEKSVVPLPEADDERDPSLQKLDSGNLSDCTLLE